MPEPETIDQLIGALSRQALAISPGGVALIPLTQQTAALLLALFSDYGRLQRNEQKEKEAGKKGGRPRKPFNELSDRQQRRRKKEEGA